MDVLRFLEEIPPTLLGILIGSLLTIIGVLLTDASNTKRLRLQHEHERAMEAQTQDLNLRRDVYLAAMEAITAGLAAVGRFSDLDLPARKLMETYTDKAPAIGRVTLIGREATIKAVAAFNLELTGAFLRLGSKRETIGMLAQRAAALREEIGRAEAQRAPAPEAELQEVDGRLTSLQIALVRQCVTELRALDRLVVPIISQMRAELGLPFKEEFYAQVLEAEHARLVEFLEAFVADQAPALEGSEAREEARPRPDSTASAG